MITGAAAQEYQFSHQTSYHTFNVPESGTYELRVWGAEGYDGGGGTGLGGYAEGRIFLNEGNQYKIQVGGQGNQAPDGSVAGGGWPDGGGGMRDNGDAGGGGGSSAIYESNTNLNNRIIVGAGGGGVGGCGNGVRGGHGGGATGNQGDEYEPGETEGGGGGTQTQGGERGYDIDPFPDAYSLGNDGSFGQGGDAGSPPQQCGTGGGGGGWYGGGSGSSEEHGDGWGAGGGGGSSYVDNSLDNTNMVTGDNAGDGYVEIELISEAASDPVIQTPTYNDVTADSSNPATFNADVPVDIDTSVDNDNTLADCSVTVTGDDNGGSYSPPTTVSGDTCEFTVENNDNSNWEPGESVTIDISATDDQGGTGSGTFSHSFTNTPPTINSVTPSDGASGVWGGDDGVNIQVDVVDWESYHTNNDLTVELYDNSLGQFATRTVSNGQGTVNLDWERNGEQGMEGFDPGSSHGWEANIEDISGSSVIQSQSFTVLNPVPNEPDSPQPADEETAVQGNHNLQVTARHPDGLDMDIRFYLDDGTGFSQVEPTRTASDGDVVSVTPNLDEGNTYTWYAEAETEGGTNESTRWSFTTNYPPSVESIDFEDSSEGHALNFTSVVSDQDGGGQVSGGTLTVTDDDGNTETYNLNPESTDGNEATFTQQVSYQDNEDWSQVEDLDFDFEVQDDPGLSASDEDSASLPNSDPVIESIGTSEYSDREAFEVSALIRSPDSGSDEIDSCSIIIESSENSYSAGTMEDVNSTHVRCVQENIGADQYPGISNDESLQLTVRATDIHGASATRGIGYNAPTGLNYRYTSMVVPTGGVDFLPYQISNDGNLETEYRVKLRNVNASFTSNGQDTRSFELGPGTTEEMQIQVSPAIGSTGTKELEIVTENINTGVNQTQAVNVKIREAEGTTERSVPGIGLLQLLVIGLFASFLYGRKIQ